MRLTLPSLTFAVLALAAASLVPVLTDPEGAAASHGRQCGVVAKGSIDYLVLAKKVGCRDGRKGVMRYLKKGKPLSGFKCEKNVGAYKFVCKNRTSKGVESYRAQRL